MRAVDVLQSLPEVDAERIGCIGHSLGGHNSLFLAAVDTRIKAAVSSCGFDTFPTYYNGDLRGWAQFRYMPRIETRYGLDATKMPFDFDGILAAIAPRGVFVSAPTRDANFNLAGTQGAIERARAVYALHGASDRLVAIHPEAEHSFPREAREAAYAALDAWLAR
jgi:dienelactone hydrolase